MIITIDAGSAGAPVSPLIRGVSGDADADYIRDVGLTLNSWGGNPASRYNYDHGHAWNAARDWHYRNGDYDVEGDAAADFLAGTAAAGAVSRLAVPTLGWVARNDDTTTCSFPDGRGGCDDAGGAECSAPGRIADPRRANVRSTADGVRAWVERLSETAAAPRFIAMDNEPDLWGVTHYDVHPECPTYEEIRDRYLEYARAIRDVAPDSLLTGPVICCWFDYWGQSPGPAEGLPRDFVTWFLEEVRRHDRDWGRRSLDVVDVHYYPQSDVFNERADRETAARRLRSVRALYDPTYIDESWIGAPIGFIPRLQRRIEAAYPGTPLMISEWNFGADHTINGALAIADVLGVLGREGVHAAAYWRSPARTSPGYFAFKMHGNYDDAGGAFEGGVLPVNAPDVDAVSAYATRDGGRVRVMLINKLPEESVTVDLRWTGFRTAASGALFRYSSAEPGQIVRDAQDTEATRAELTLPAYSVTLLLLDAAEPRA